MINFFYCSKGAKGVVVIYFVEETIVVDLLYREGMRVSGGRRVYLEKLYIINIVK